MVRQRLLVPLGWLHLLMIIQTVGWINTLTLYADIFGVRAFEIVHIIATSGICLVWAILVVLTVIAFWKGEILMSSDEDIAEENYTKRLPTSSRRTSITLFPTHSISP